MPDPNPNDNPNDRPTPPDQTNPLDPAPEPPLPRTPRKVKAGDDVTCVTAYGHRIPATVKAVKKGGLIDLTCEHRGEELTITSSPYDPNAQKPDSWH